MLFSTKRVSDLLYNSDRMLEVASTDVFINAALVAANYDVANLATLRTQWNTTSAKVRDFNDAIKEQRNAKSFFKKTHRDSRELYIKHVRFGRFVCRDDAGKMTKLGLDEPRARHFNDWVLQGVDFYSHAVPDTALAADYTAKYGITADELILGQQGITKANSARVLYNAAIGNTQDSRIERDKAMTILDRGVKELALVCRYALKANPQQLEKLRILVYTPGYKKKTKEKKPETPEPPAVSETPDTGGTEEPVPVEPEPPAEIPAEATG